MNIVCYCPRSGGQQTRQFKSLRKAKQFLPEACRRDAAGFAYLVIGRHNLARAIQQWHDGRLYKIEASDYYSAEDAIKAASR